MIPPLINLAYNVNVVPFSPLSLTLLALVSAYTKPFTSTPVIKTALAVFPDPPLLDVTTSVVLVKLPKPLVVTFTLTRQKPPAAMLPALSPIVLPLLAPQ